MLSSESILISYGQKRQITRLQNYYFTFQRFRMDACESYFQVTPILILVPTCSFSDALALEVSAVKQKILEAIHSLISP